MHVRFSHPSGHRDLVVCVDHPDATVADLTEALEPDRAAGPLLVDGRSVPAATPLDRARIGDGAVLARAPIQPQPTPTTSGADADPVLTITVSAGVDAGRSFALPPGTYGLGRADAVPVGPAWRLGIADPTVSADHLRIVVDHQGALVVSDQGSTNGSWLGTARITGPTPVQAGQVVQCGAARLTVDRPHPVRRPATQFGGGHPTGARTRPLHRPPRPDPPPDLPALVLPEPPAPTATVTPVGVLAVAAPLVVGAVMVLVLGSWTYALFALLSPVLMIATSLDARHRRRRSRRRGSRRRRVELTLLAGALAERCHLAANARAQRYPGPDWAARVAAGPSAACWERRPHHPDAYAVRIGVGAATWSPPVVGDGSGWDPDVTEVMERHRVITDVALGLRLTPGRPVAVVGPPSTARAAARSMLLQAATTHGPADLCVSLLTAPDRGEAWDWCAWLPHARHPRSGSLLAASPGRCDAVAAVLTRKSTVPLTLVVVDHPEALAARRSAARTVVRAALDPEVGLVPLVLVPSLDEVPAACSVVLVVDAGGSLTGPHELLEGTAVVVGTAADVATDVARALARLDDPEADDLGRGLPDALSLATLIGADRITPQGIAARWSATGPDPSPHAVLGMAADGPLTVDLATDGPHVLVAGTTGSGKSELLRTLVASMAAGSSPDHLTFVLVDFKGGSAFDSCEHLPHVTGVVTDLDQHLAARAIRCLEAELSYRERRLREAGADDLTDFRRQHRGREPLPRLVVVIDEFATLAAELPDFVDSLIGVAQRGRSLGVHLVLATQRPSGSVSENIRANTSLRVALRVQAAADSTDVIASPDAANLSRQRPGRALVRFGPGELVAIQVALSTATTPNLVGGVGDRTPAVRVRPLGVATAPDDLNEPKPGCSGGGQNRRTDLDVLVDAIGRAWTSLGGAPPRRPWPDPLPTDVRWPLEGPDGGSPELIVGLADEPEHQRQVRFAWKLADGPLLVVGRPGSGTTTLAATAVLSAARRWSPNDCHVQVIDLGAGALGPLVRLPHVGSVIGSDDLERQRRLLAELGNVLAARRAATAITAAPTAESSPPGGSTAVGPIIVVVVDGLGDFRARWDDLEPTGTWARLEELADHGAEVGIHLLLTMHGVAAAPQRLVAACRQRLVMGLSDRADYLGFGIGPAEVPFLPPGRGMATDGATIVQVARPAAGIASAVTELIPSPNVAAVTRAWAQPVGVLPVQVGLDEIAYEVPPPTSDGSASLLIGVSDVGLAPARIDLPPGGHALVSGPPHSGRTTALATIARSATAIGLRVVVVARTTDAWPRAATRYDPDDPGLAPALHRPGPVLVVVDDADLTRDDHPLLRRITADRRPDRHVVASGRNDRLRGLWGHWTRELRPDRCGLLLWPDPDVDGELTGARLPRRPTVAMTAGRAWLSGGHPEGFCQIARADAGPGPGTFPTI